MDGYSQILVIGYGVVTGEVLSYIDMLSGRYRYTTTYIEHEKHPFNGARKYAKANGIESYTIEDKNELLRFFSERIKRGKTLIVSASSNYLFPRNLVEAENTTIMNFHNALLPDLPGRNAPSWAIYKGYKQTGITWHYVSAGIDEGDIIIQKECPIEPDTKAYELVAAQMHIAGDAFKECFESVLNDSATTRKQEFSANRRVYKSFEIPGDGKFDLDDEPENIYRLLRALDYGKNNIFPNPTTVIDGKKALVKRYKKVALMENKDELGKLYLPLDKEFCLMIKFSA